MKQTVCWMKAVLTAVLVVGMLGWVGQAQAADLPLAAASPLTGVAFDDRPLLLPVQRNFQMAMLTAGSELGRSCGKMEAYGWRMGQTEQGRVNQIFNNTVDRLRLMGYSITPQTLSSVSKDITLFTADGSNRHFIFLWSAGELGLVLNICETTAPTAAANRAGSLVPSVQVFPVPMESMPKSNGRYDAGSFTPIGEWVGGYTCAQGYTGGTLIIDKLRGRDFEGVFKFYATPKNPTEPAGSYTVYGQYDKDSKRILINPGKWIKRPRNFYNTVIVGSFDPVHDGFSAYFQGISGCTSFEATRADTDYITPTAKPHKKHVVKKKKVVKKVAPVVAAPVASSDNSVAPAPMDNAPLLAPAPADTAPAAAPVATPVTPALVTTPAAPPQPVAPPAPVSSAVPAVPVTPALQPATAPAQAPTLPAEDKNSGGGILLAAPPSGK